MNESRLHHLRRQQTLLREHLSWIEAEIARETTRQPLANPPAEITAEPAFISSPSSTPSTSLPPDNADELIEQYAAGERQNPNDVRRGCLLVFFGTLTLLGGILTLIWLLRYR